MPENSSSYSTVADHQDIQHWNSPVPYLFSGLALLLGLIALALMILACSFRKNTITYTQTQPNSGDNEQEKPPRSSLPSPEMEPKIVVIMAGDHYPTYLAKPVASSSSNRDVAEV